MRKNWMLRFFILCGVRLFKVHWHEISVLFVTFVTSYVCLETKLMNTITKGWKYLGQLRRQSTRGMAD